MRPVFLWQGMVRGRRAPFIHRLVTCQQDFNGYARKDVQPHRRVASQRHWVGSRQGCAPMDVAASFGPLGGSHTASHCSQSRAVADALTQGLNELIQDVSLRQLRASGHPELVSPRYRTDRQTSRPCRVDRTQATIFSRHGDGRGRRSSYTPRGHRADKIGPL